MVLHFKGKDAIYFAKKLSYVETTTAVKQKYHEENLHVTTEDQRWLSSRVVDIVVFTPSNDVSQVPPMNRLDDIWPDVSRSMTFHILPPDVLTDENSISFCESHRAITSRTPGYDNACEGDGHLQILDQWNRRAEDPIRKRVEEPPAEAPAPSQPQPIAEHVEGRFRNLEIVHHARQPVLQPDDPDLAYHLEDAPDFDVNELQRTTLGREYEDSKPTGPVSETILEFYSNVADRLQYRLGESRDHDIQASDILYGTRR
ncbi:hypothetical protein Aduo_005139 [Ancylostoma duodenale]